LGATVGTVTVNYFSVALLYATPKVMVIATPTSIPEMKVLEDAPTAVPHRFQVQFQPIDVFVATMVSGFHHAAFLG
jgi:hypothetical protein